MNGRYEVGDIILGNWKLVRLVGASSFGRVFEAQREEFGRTYKAAMKIITIPRFQSEVDNMLGDGMDLESVTGYFESIVDDLIEELTLLFRLKGNTNIVNYEDHQILRHTEGIGWDIIIRMELLMPLLDYTRDKFIPVKEVIRIGIDICNALELCQKYNIIHRDIKAENIFVTELDIFKLGDFGIARTVEKITSGMSKQGTFKYMAPEIFHGKDYGADVDLYALGLVLYRFLNDKRFPFEPTYPAPIVIHEKESAVVTRLNGAQIPPPRNADEDLAKIVLKACAFNPSDRYSSPAKMRDDLLAVLTGYQNSGTPHFQTGEETTANIGEPGKSSLLQNEQDEIAALYGDSQENLFQPEDYEEEIELTERVQFYTQKNRDIQSPPLINNEYALMVVNTAPPPDKKSKIMSIIKIAAPGAMVFTAAIVIALLILFRGGEEYYPGANLSVTPDNDYSLQTHMDDDPDEIETYALYDNVYDDYGRLIRQPIMDGASLIGWFEFLYDNDNNVIQQAKLDVYERPLIRRFYENGSLSHWWENQLDDYGNVINAARYNDKGIRARSVARVFDLDRMVVKTTNSWYDDTGELVRFEAREFHDNGEVRLLSFYEVADTTERLTGSREFCADGNLVFRTRIFHDEYGIISGQVENEYDRYTGLLRFIREFNYNNIKIGETEFVYDENAEETERIEREFNNAGAVVRTLHFRPGAARPFRTIPPVRIPPPPPQEEPPPPEEEPLPLGCVDPRHGVLAWPPISTWGYTQYGHYRLLRDTFWFECGCVSHHHINVHDEEGRRTLLIIEEVD